MNASGNFVAQHIVDVKINSQSDLEGVYHCTVDWCTSATGAGSDGIKTLSSCPRTAPCNCNAAQDGERISGTTLPVSTAAEPGHHGDCGLYVGG